MKILKAMAEEEDSMVMILKEDMLLGEKLVMKEALKEKLNMGKLSDEEKVEDSKEMMNGELIQED